MIKLDIGQEVWGYIESPVVKLNTKYQAYGSVTRVATKRYCARIGGRPDGTGFEKYYPTLQRAMVAVRLPLDGEILSGSSVMKLNTSYS